MQVPYNEWRYFALRLVADDVTETLNVVASSGTAEEELESDIVDTEIASTGMTSQHTQTLL